MLHVPGDRSLLLFYLSFLKGSSSFFHYDFLKI